MPGMIGINVKHIQTLIRSIHVLLLESLGKICKLCYFILVQLSGYHRTYICISFELFFRLKSLLFSSKILIFNDLYRGRLSNTNEIFKRYQALKHGKIIPWSVLFYAEFGNIVNLCLSKKFLHWQN